MRSFEKYSTFYFLLYFLILVTWSFILFITEQRTSQWNYFFNVAYALFYLCAGVVAYQGVKISGMKNSVGKQLFSISISMITNAIALFIWAYYNLVLKVEIPYPSLADVFSILYIPFLGYGIINLLRGFGILFNRHIYIQHSQRSASSCTNF